jgi:DEAD/DEAH box helicase domain-containing protein
MRHEDLNRYIATLKHQGKYRASIVSERVLDEKPADHVPVTVNFHPALARFIEQAGISFYSHQASAIEKIAAGTNVVVATSTASGKSICYLLPILDALLHDTKGTAALLVFPLKALAQDQLQRIQYMLSAVGLPETLAGVYDADATSDEKRKMRAGCSIIITNPYGLHQYLGNLRLWKPFFERLRFVVLDELHVYNGVFGSNIAMVMRRLRRVVAAFGSEPQWIACSATIGNPGELASTLTGLPFEVVDNDGAPRAKKRIWFWNPMFIEHMNQRLSVNQDTKILFSTFITGGYQTLAFTQSRKMAELQAKWARDAFIGTPYEGRVMPYRAGYPAHARRALEQQLRDGELAGISATSALELGIDIGSLEVVIVSGFPGSITSFWQQAGRCGRGTEDSLVVYCAGSDALDQYYVEHPDEFFRPRLEDAVIDLSNKYIVKGHLECAAKELPVTPADLDTFGPGSRAAIEQLAREGVVINVSGRYVHIRTDFPAERVSLNSIPSEAYKVFDMSSGTKRLLTVETENRVFSTLHEGAIFLYMAETYRVSRLDLVSKEVDLVKEDVDYYTQARFDTSISPVVAGEDGTLENATKPASLVPTTEFSRGDGFEPLQVFFGDVKVASKSSRYLVKSLRTDETIESRPLDLPTTSFFTKSMWFNVPADVQVALDEAGKDLLGGAIHAVEHGSIGLFPRHVLCSRWDIGGVSIDMDPLYKKPMIYIYDGFPGGIGLAERATGRVIELLDDTVATIRNCPCKSDNGCPSCIQSPKCGNGNEPLSKKGAIILLDGIVSNISRE